jgi:hypothetical protein
MFQAFVMILKGSDVGLELLNLIYIFLNYSGLLFMTDPAVYKIQKHSNPDFFFFFPFHKMLSQNH